MAGTFLSGEIKTRPGVYFRTEKSGVEVSGATNGILAILFQSNFGELNKVVSLDPTQANNLGEIFGDGAEVLAEGFKGGAKLIRAVRVGGDDGTCAAVTFKGVRVEDVLTEQEKTIEFTGGEALTVTLETLPHGDSFHLTSGNEVLIAGNAYELDGKNLTILAAAFGLGDTSEHELNATWQTVTGEREVEFDAVKLSSKHVGARTFTATIRTNLITNGRQLLIYDGTEIFTSATFEGEDEAQALVDALNGNKFFAAQKLSSGALKDVVQAQLTGGKNPTVTMASYLKGTDLLERFKWNCIVADSDEAAVNGILTAFVRQSYEAGHLGFACIAGKSSTDLESRESFAASCNDEKIAFVLNGWKSNDGTIYDGWRAAVRIGAMIAACDTTTSLTHAVIDDALELLEPLTNSEITQAEEKGCLVLSLNADDQIQIDNAINTLVTPDANQDSGWKKIRRTKTRFELIQRCNDTCEPLIGKVNNNRNGRATILGACQKIINEMCAEEKLYAGSKVEEDSRYTPEGDRAYFLFTIGDVDSIEKLYLTYRFSYANPFVEE